MSNRVGYSTSYNSYSDSRPKPTHFKFLELITLNTGMLLWRTITYKHDFKTQKSIQIYCDSRAF